MWNREGGKETRWIDKGVWNREGGRETRWIDKGVWNREGGKALFLSDITCIAALHPLHRCSPALPHCFSPAMHSTSYRSARLPSAESAQPVSEQRPS